MRTPAFRIADGTTFMEPYQTLSSHSVTHPPAGDVIATFLYSCSEMMKGDWQNIERIYEERLAAIE